MGHQRHNTLRDWGARLQDVACALNQRPKNGLVLLIVETQGAKNQEMVLDEIIPSDPLTFFLPPIPMNLFSSFLVPMRGMFH